MVKDSLVHMTVYQGFLLIKRKEEKSYKKPGAAPTEVLCWPLVGPRPS